MTAVLERAVETDSGERLAQARAHRRRWARDAMLLRTIDPDAVSDTAALGGLPDWADAPPASRTRLAVLGGAVLCSRRLRRTIDGRVLSAVAAVLGEHRLDAVLALPGRVRALDSLGWGDEPVEQLHALGGEVLVRSVDVPASIREALSRLFPRSAQTVQADRATLCRIAGDALMFWDRGEPARAVQEER
jgi:hypothetical protein